MLARPPAFEIFVILDNNEMDKNATFLISEKGNL